MDSTSLQLRLADLISTHGVPAASVAVLRQGETVAASAGILNINTGIEATVDSVFQAGSITKVYTATLVMQLVDEGELDLDEPATAYIADLEYGADPLARGVTVRQLLCHTSGVYGDHDLHKDYGRGEDAVERYVAGCNQVTQIHPPGAIVSYCNSGYVVLGRLVEVLRGKPYNSVLRERLLEPAGLGETAALPEEAILRRAAAGHVPESPTSPRLKVAASAYMQTAFAPAGALMSATPRDLIKFAQIHLAEGQANGVEILSPQSVKAMQQPQAPLPPNLELRANAWGLGWYLLDWNGTVGFGHDGGTIGQASFLRVFPKSETAVAIMINAVRGGARLIEELAAELIRDLTGAEMPMIGEALPPGVVDVARFAGSFSQPDIQISTRAADDDLLILISRRDKTGALKPSEELPLKVLDDNMFAADIDGTLTAMSFFGFEDDGRPRYLFVGGRTMVRRDA